jgi:hypothetical protein
MANSKNVLINSRERAVSSDINVLQEFEARSRQNADGAGLEQIDADLWARARYTTRAAAGSYLPATVLSGLLVNCDNAAYVTVAPGTVECYAPALAGANDSPFVVVTDVGVTAITVLLFVANAGAGPRIDVVECQPIADPAPATASRDIYDPTTGLFTAALVTKYQGTVLAYRIRNGAAGGACPAADPDWLPLAVAVVLVGATGYDKCDWYDVRPLLAERVGHLSRQVALSGVSNEVTPFELAERHLAVDYNAAGKCVVTGFAYGAFGGYMAGGHVHRNAAISGAAMFGTNVLYTDGAVKYLSMCADNEVAAWVPVASATVQVVAMFPGLGAVASPLPRWRRYEQVPGAAPRLPAGSNGILCLSTYTGSENRRIENKTLPVTLTGLGPASGVSLGEVQFDAAGTDLQPAASLGAMMMMATPVGGTASVAVAAGPPTWAIQWTLARSSVPGSVPGTARKIRVEVKVKIADGGAPGYQRLLAVWSLWDAGATARYATFKTDTFVASTAAADAGFAHFYLTVDVPLLPPWGNVAASGATVTLQLALTNQGGQPNPTAVAADHLLYVLGWE